MITARTFGEVTGPGRLRRGVGKALIAGSRERARGGHQSNLIMIATVHRSQKIEDVAAPQLELVSTAEFYREAVAWFGGPACDLQVEVLECGEGDLIEVFGSLPCSLRAGLRRAYAFWEYPRRGWVPWRRYGSIVWHTSSDGYGPRFAISGLGTLIDLVAERRLALEGGEAC
jgi:hypothetical protein